MPRLPRHGSRRARWWPLRHLPRPELGEQASIQHVSAIGEVEEPLLTDSCRGVPRCNPVLAVSRELRQLHFGDCPGLYAGVTHDRRDPETELERLLAIGIDAELPEPVDALLNAG